MRLDICSTIAITRLCSSCASGERLPSTTATHRFWPLVIVVDFIHVAQYVWDAALTFVPEDLVHRDGWVRTHLLEILRGKASTVAAGIRRSATRRAMAAADRQPVDACADYLLDYAHYLMYDKALAEGLPIASGVVEGACRHLVDDRMNVTGAWWSLQGAEAVLRLRALRASDDFEAYWSFHERHEYERHRAAHYADAHVPATTRPEPPKEPHSRGRRRTLKFVKHTRT